MNQKSHITRKKILNNLSLKAGIYMKNKKAENIDLHYFVEIL